MNDDVDGFDDTIINFMPRLTQFMTKKELDLIFKDKNHLFKLRDNIKDFYKIKSKKVTYEVEPYFGSCKVSVYLNKKGNNYISSEKYLASHVLEQIIDKQGNIISEEIKLFNCKM